MGAKKLVHVGGRLHTTEKNVEPLWCTVHCAKMPFLPIPAPLKKRSASKASLIIVGNFANVKKQLVWWMLLSHHIATHDSAVRVAMHCVFFLLLLVQVPKHSDVDKRISQGSQKSCPADASSIRCFAWGSCFAMPPAHASAVAWHFFTAVASRNVKFETDVPRGRREHW